MTAPVVLSSDEPGVATITLNRPDVLNAMSVELMESLRSTLVDVAEDPAVRCVLLRGAGRSFCAGGDFADIEGRRRSFAESDGPGAVAEGYHRLMIRHTESVSLLRAMPKPTIAVVQGWAVGGGMSLALAADFRVIETSTRLRAGFAARSLSGDFGISWLLVSAVGGARARDLLMRDRVVDAQTAMQLGLATTCCALEDLDATGTELAASLAAAPTIALGRMKDNLNAAETYPLSELLVRESANQRVAATTSDAREAGLALAEGRDPVFTGR
jgi:2-(1,2-epoxy-1,2-dihydrophenyl)acetyl-CoA isomerase